MAQLTIADLGTILSVWAHPDDETFLAGGVMSAAVEDGHHVVCVSATAGEHGTDDPTAWPPARLGALRREEALAAMNVLGVSDHRVLGYEDGTLAALDPEEPVARLGALIEEVQPDTILTFGPDGMTFHPDHRAVSAWVTAAWRGHPGSARLLHAASAVTWLAEWMPTYERWGVFMTDERPVGVPDESLCVDLRLDAEALDRKVAALRAMPSQTDASIEALGIELFRAESSRECFVEVDDSG